MLRCFPLARTDPDAPEHAGVSALLVDMRSPGIRVRPPRQMTGDADFNEVFFDGVLARNSGRLLVPGPAAAPVLVDAGPAAAPVLVDAGPGGLRARTGHMIKIGIPLFLLRPEQLVRVARRAEELGFESVWMPEHLVFPTRFESRYPYSTDGVPPIPPHAPLLDPLLVLARIAGATSRIRLGTNVYLLALRHPVVAARLVATLDLLSEGRFSLGVGVGWLKEEFDAAGVDFAKRGALTRECIRAMRVLWTEPEPTFVGRHHAFGPLKFEPKPVQKPHPPILIGGESDAALRRAAAVGDGWYGVRHTPESVAERIRTLHSLLDEAGRAKEGFEITIGPSAGDLDRDSIRRFADAGVDRVVVLPWTRAREAEDRMADLAERLLPAAGA